MSEEMMKDTQTLRADRIKKLQDEIDAIKKLQGEGGK